MELFKTLIMNINQTIITSFCTACFLTVIACNPKPADQGIEWTKEKDAKTGREVWQITSHDSASEACYFEAQAFTANDKYMVFSSKRTCEWQFYRCCGGLCHHPIILNPVVAQGCR